MDPRNFLTQEEIEKCNISSKVNMLPAYSAYASKIISKIKESHMDKFGATTAEGWKLIDKFNKEFCIAKMQARHANTRSKESATYMNTTTPNRPYYRPNSYSPFDYIA